MADESDDIPTARQQERLLLAAILRGSGDEQKRACSQLPAEAFEAWPTVARVVWDIHNEGGHADYDTVASRLEGGIPDPIANATPPTTNIGSEYVPQIRDAHLGRTMGAAFIDIGRRALEGEDPTDLREEAEEVTMEVSKADTTDPIRPAGDFVEVARERFEAQEGAETIGIPSGIDTFDQKTRGFQDGHQYVVAGRPQMGKTNFVLNVLLHAAKNGRRVSIISAEMVAPSLTSRLAHIESGVTASPGGRRIRRSEQATRDYNEALDQIQELPFYIVDPANPTPADVVALMRRAVSAHDADIIAIDYLQKLSPPKGKERWVGDAAHRIQGESQHLGIPVLLLSQLNRGVESRAEKRPQMSDLRESGAIEEAADHITFLYRPEYYGINRDQAGNDTTGMAEAIIAKDRVMGNTGRAKMYFDTDCGQFASLEQRRGASEPTRGDGAPAPDQDWASPGNPGEDDVPF